VKRKTLPQQIASCKTTEQKWGASLWGGPPPTAIEQFAFDAYTLAQPTAHGPQWHKEARDRMKARFSDLFFPALMKDEREPFQELVEAMSAAHGYRGQLVQFVKERNTGGTSKKEAGRLLRNALLSMALSRDKRGLRSLASVREYLERINKVREEAMLAPVEYGSDSQLYDRTRALCLCLKSVLDEKGEKLTIRQVATFLAHRNFAETPRLDTPADGFSRLRRICREINFPLAETRHVT
jgi:hypothetical protein